MSARPIIVFAGPSLPPAARPQDARFQWRAPAMAGDALAALEERPAAVLLIDGLFDRYPAIRHKELLALIEAGVAVVGGASMGALRAAELHTLGMVGVGAIFEAYARGALVGDDEVAVLHGPAEMDWAPLTIPLVNVRATLARAARAGIIGIETARGLRSLAAEIFYQDRTWRSLLDAAEGRIARDEIERFAAWVATGYVDLKQQDALACLAVAAALPSTASRGGKAAARTVFIEALARQVSQGRKPRLASS
jgi:hypothetical protein